MPRPSKRTPRPLTERRKRNRQAATEVKAAAYRIGLEIANELPPYDGTYSEALGLAMADMVIEGAMLDELGSLPNMPPRRQILRWVADKDHPFSKLYYTAKRAFAALYEERALRAGTTINKTVLKVKRQAIDRDGNVVDLIEEREVDNTQRSELEMKAYQWSLGWIQPAKHGRQAVPDDGKGPNEQLTALFEALKAGPSESNVD